MGTSETQEICAMLLALEKGEPKPRTRGPIAAQAISRGFVKEFADDPFQRRIEWKVTDAGREFLKAHTR